MVTARAVLYPSNGTYDDIKWRITNANGIDSNLASLEINGKNVKITALGDGTVYLRCFVKNGSDKIKLYSQMEFNISGFGSASLNPYEFISAGLYSFGTSNLTNGNDRGVATARDGMSMIGFERIDFGEFGSNEIVLPIFSLDDEKFPIEIWEGIAGEPEAVLLDTITYQKPSVWNVYQDETYKPSQKIKRINFLKLCALSQDTFKRLFLCKT